jgi:hypothetical protein
MLAKRWKGCMPLKVIGSSVFLGSKAVSSCYTKGFFLVNHFFKDKIKYK